MIYLLITILAILFFGLTWKNQLLGLQITLFALPTYLIRSKLLAPFTILELMILINFIVWFSKNISLIHLGLKNRLNKTGVAVEYPFGIEMVLVAMVGMFGVAMAGFSSNALGIWKAYFFEPILLIIVIYQIFGRLEINFEEKFKKLATPLIYSAILIAVIAIYQKMTGNLIYNTLWQAGSTRRVVSVFGYPNAVGLYLETIIMYAFALGLITLGVTQNKLIDEQKITSKKFDAPKFLFYLVALTMSLLSIAFTKSNGALLGLIGGFSIFSLLYSRQTRLIWMGTLLICTSLFFATGFQKEKITEYLTLQDFSGQVRKIGWDDSWKMLKDGRIFTGAGLSNFQNTVAPYHVPGFYFNRDHDANFLGKLLIFNDAYRAKYWQPLEVYMYPHNIVLNFWSELGLFGLLVFTWLIGKFYYLAVKYLHAAKGHTRLIIITTISAMTTIIVHGLVDVPFFKNDLAIIFWLPIVILGLYQLEYKTANLKIAKKSLKLAK